MSDVEYGDGRLPQRIWDKIYPEPNTGCWLWAAQTTDRGYGVASWRNRPHRAHRLLYETLIGATPDGLVLDHLCRVRSCCNPEHLEPVTCRENLLRGEGFAATYSRATHCHNGHGFTPENTRLDKYGHRSCAVCSRVNSVAWLARQDPEKRDQIRARKRQSERLRRARLQECAS